MLISKLIQFELFLEPLMKWITRFSLFLVLFLLMGDSHLRLHEEDCIDCRTSGNPANHGHLHYHSSERNHFLYARVRPARTKKYQFGIDATAPESNEETEDDESEDGSTAKRNVNTGNYFSSAYYLQPLSYLNGFLGKACSQVQHYLYYSSYRYIVFRVIRI